MSRTARIVVPGCVHHVTQRGNNQQDVFASPDDRRRYLQFLAEKADRYGLAVHGYCLMTNHVHLVVTPRAPDSLAKAVGRTHWEYAQYANQAHGRSGHLWQSRFYSCSLAPDRALWALRYVELNPVRAGLVADAKDYEWSSAAYHCGAAPHRGWTEPVPGMPTPEDWAGILAAGQPDDERDAVRNGTIGGRVVGSDAFVEGLMTAFGRRVQTRRRGRPRKDAQ